MRRFACLCEHLVWTRLTLSSSCLLPGVCRAMAHDEIRYKDPMSFNPERFLGPKPEEDPAQLIFGFGRR